PGQGELRARDAQLVGDGLQRPHPAGVLLGEEALPELLEAREARALRHAVVVLAREHALRQRAEDDETHALGLGLGPDLLLDARAVEERVARLLGERRHPAPPPSLSPRLGDARHRPDARSPAVA